MECPDEFLHPFSNRIGHADKAQPYEIFRFYGRIGDRRFLPIPVNKYIGYPEDSQCLPCHLLVFNLYREPVIICKWNLLSIFHIGVTHGKNLCRASFYG